MYDWHGCHAQSKWQVSYGAHADKTRRVTLERMLNVPRTGKAIVAVACVFTTKFVRYKLVTNSDQGD